MKGYNLKRVCLSAVVCALIIQMLSVISIGDTCVQTSQVDFEGGTTLNTSVTLSPGNVTLALSQDWWDSNWNYRIPIDITENSGNTLTNFQILVTIDTASPIFSGKMRGDGGDIRFINASGTLIPHWVESGINSVNTKIWINVSYIPEASTTTIFMYCQRNTTRIALL